MSDSTLNGGCRCGAVRYRVRGRLASSSICFCRSCRVSGGAQSVAWLTVSVDSLDWSARQPKRYRSSPGVTRSFCADCGTPLSYQHDSVPATIDLTTATLDRPEDVPPTRETWLSDKLTWAASNEDLEHWPEDAAER